MPARFVAGHFLRSDGMVNQQAGHAWAEAHVPDLGWVGFDPANGNELHRIALPCLETTACAFGGPDLAAAIWDAIEAKRRANGAAR